MSTPATGQRRSLAWPVLAAVLAVAFVRILVSLARPFSPYGDVAVIELAVMRATQFHQLLGPYSRFGWNHPGPAYFYALAPFYAAGHHSTRALFAGALAVAGASAVATVAVMRRRAGELAARFALGALGAYLLAVGPSRLIDPWNPSAVRLPLLLTVVLAAVAASGSLPALAWSVLAGSFAVQTHIGTAPTVAAVVAVAGGMLLVGHREPLSPGGRRLGMAGLAVALAMWAPPLYQEATGHPGNLTRIVSFFLSPPRGTLQHGHSVRAALAALADELSRVPLGRLAPGAAFTSTTPARAATAAIYLALALAVTVVARRRRDRLAFSLGTMTLLATAAAALSATRVIGPLAGYLIGWIAVLPVPAWIGAGVLAVAAWEEHPAARLGLSRAGAASLALLPGAPMAALARAAATAPMHSFPNFSAVASSTAAAEADLRKLGTRSVTVSIGAGGYPVGAGVVVGLVKAGYNVSVPREWLGVFGGGFEEKGDKNATLVVADPRDLGPHGPPAGATTTDTPYGDATVWVDPAPRSAAVSSR